MKVYEEFKDEESYKEVYKYMIELIRKDGFLVQNCNKRGWISALKYYYKIEDSNKRKLILETARIKAEYDYKLEKLNLRFGGN